MAEPTALKPLARIEWSPGDGRWYPGTVERVLSDGLLLLLRLDHNGAGLFSQPADVRPLPLGPDDSPPPVDKAIQVRLDAIASGMSLGEARRRAIAVATYTDPTAGERAAVTLAGALAQREAELATLRQRVRTLVADLLGES